ncbi:MAG TPA: TonB-dependent receptor [Vicinamibacterales bacterium]|nr:TonB-dependent receptor [Vicinamibacterales bacterium]
MRLPFTIAFGLLALAAVPAPASAQTPGQPPPGSDLSGKSLEALLDVPVDSVEGAARHTQRITEAPASVTVITANDIETFGWRTLAEVLRSVRGFHVTYDRNYSYVGVRAFGRPTDYNNRVLVLLNGHRVNDSIYDGALVGSEFPVDLAMVDRIEVVRGPGSALYGTSAFFAVVNVITKRGAHVRAGDVQFEAGSFDTYKVRASHGWSDASGRDLLLSVTRYQSGGHPSLYFPEFDAPETNSGLAVGNDDDKATDVLASARFGNFQVNGVVGDRKKRVPTGSWGTTFNDPRFFTRDVRGWATLGYTRDMGPMSVTLGGYYDRYHYSGLYPFGGLYDDGAFADAVGGDATVRWRAGRHAFTTGVEQRTNLRQDQWYGLGASREIDDRRTSQEMAVFGQDEIALTSRLTAVLGARYDWWSLKGGTGRPRLGLVYRTADDTAIKALYGEAYRAPNLYELYYTSAQIAAAPNLEPELARTMELVFERRLGRHVRSTATGYYTRSSNLIDPEFSYDDTVQYGNKESVRSSGVEFEAESRWSSGVLVRGSLAVQHAVAIETSQQLSNAPGQLATIHLAAPFWRRQLVAASESIFTSGRTTVGGDLLPSFWLSNFTLTYRPVRMPLTIGASVYNAFDALYADPVGVEFRQSAIPQDRRTASVRVTVKF